MGRNSVETTKASLIRAVRARRAARTAGLTGFLGFIAVELVLADLLAVGAGFFAVGAAFWIGFFAGIFLAGEETCPVGLVVELFVDCPATGDTINKKESRPAIQQEVRCE